ncbi:hypothetical protein [Streptomyces griseus]|uniref:hypothetical protein n=1 Tax=Streptomyces griseus TaxID=1911 RepID=UPI003663C2FF
MTNTSPTPADQLRAAADLLREAAGHATPGPWRTHDTHLGRVGGHTATVLTGRPNLNDTELIAWLPTMSHEPWDETRNAWRNAGWMALMHPGVGLALAAWLESWVGVDLSEHGPMPEDAQHALAVARRILGTSAAEGATVDLEPQDHPGADLFVALQHAGLDADEANRRMYAYARMVLRQEKATAAPPAPADRAAVLREAADAALAVPTPDCAEMSSLTGAWEAGQWAAVAELRRLADGAAAGVQPPNEEEALTARWDEATGKPTPLCPCGYVPVACDADRGCTPPAAPAAPEEPAR